MFAQLLYIQDHPAVRPDLCRVIVCTTFLLASTAFWWLANCCGPLFLYLAASWTCLFFVLLVTSLIGFGLKVRAEEVKGSRREKCERSDTSDSSRSLRFKDLLMLRSFRVIKYRECEEALEVAQAVSTLSSRSLQQDPPSSSLLQPHQQQHHHPNCPHHHTATSSSQQRQNTVPPPKQHRHLYFADEGGGGSGANHVTSRHHHHHNHHKSPLLSGGGRHHHHHHHHHQPHSNNVTSGGDVIKQQHLKRQHTSPPLSSPGEDSFVATGSRDFLAL